MTRATKTQAMRVAARLGATIEEDVYPDGGALYAYAPAGTRWATRGVHAVCSPYDFGGKPEAWADLIDGMGMGIEPCPDGGDDNCRSSGCEKAGVE